MPLAPGPQPVVEASSSGCWGGGAGERGAGQEAAWGSASVFLPPSLSFESPSGKEGAFRGGSPGKGKGQSRTSLMPALPGEQRIRGLHILGAPHQVGTNSHPPGRITQSPASPPLPAKPGCVSSLGEGAARPRLLPPGVALACPLSPVPASPTPGNSAPFSLVLHPTLISFSLGLLQPSFPVFR